MVKKEKSVLPAQNYVVLFFSFFLISVFTGCKKGELKYDAAGTFEATDIILSSEVNGKIIHLDVNEGDEIKEGQVIVKMDTVSLNLQKEQAEAAVQSLIQKQNSPSPQINVFYQQLSVAEYQIKTLQEQMVVLKKEQKRMSDLYKGDAATAQQVDDINGKVDILQYQIYTAEKQHNMIKSQIKSAKDQISIQNRGIMSEKSPLEKKVALIEDQIQRTSIISPINGTVLTKYAEQGEFIGMGKPVLKLADLSELTLKAYITGNQLPMVKLGQEVDIFVDNGSSEPKFYKGTVSSISDKAEFTPKTIQTKEERANLVYAIKIYVKNDGHIKIGMYGDVSFTPSTISK